MAKINDIRVLAEETASDVASSPRDWMAYLDTAAKLYRYPFADNLLIHAQHPQATACAELETWNEKMGRWVNRGAKGIALIDDTGPRQRLRYVFDIEDTHMVRGGRTPYLWKMEFHKVKLPKDTHDCAVCGDHPTILEPIDYEQEVCEETAGRFATRDEQ